MREDRHKGLWRYVQTVFAFVSAITCCAIAAAQQEVPVVDAHLGQCKADFTVRDGERKPIYDAKIDVEVRYGFLGLHKMELQVGTNSGGKARVAGLPEKSKKSLEFHITHGSLSKVILINPSEKCSASTEVDLAK